MATKRNAKGQFVGNHSPGGNDRSNRVTMNHSGYRDMVFNALLSRQDLVKKLLDPRRDIDDECGYPKTDELKDSQYKLLYDREPIAARVVEVMPKESWNAVPSVFEDEDASVETEFEKAWTELGNELMGTSWYQESEEGNPIWELLKRADILSGIANYGIILLGIDDGSSLVDPLPGLDEMGKKVSAPKDAKLVYATALDEEMVDIVAYESNPLNPRFGQPTKYSVTLNDPGLVHSGIGLPLATHYVHWSRVIHLADNQGSSRVFGVPRMRPVYNRLYDLRKMYGGSAEMYWRGAFPGLSLETHPALGGDVEINTSDLRDEMTNYMDGLQRYMTLSGMTAKSLAPQVVDPTPQINIQIEAICIHIGIPKRIFMGSERGELSSIQDENTWATRIANRRNTYLTPRVVAPFIDRLIAVGVLPEPESYSIVWPSTDTVTPSDKASIALTKIEALVKYIQGGGDSLVAPMDFLTKVWEMKDEEAQSVLDSAIEQIEEEGKILEEPEPEEKPFEQQQLFGEQHGVTP